MTDELEIQLGEPITFDASVHVTTRIGLHGACRVVEGDVQFPLLYLTFPPDTVADELVLLRLDSIHGERMVDVMADGSVVFGENYDPGEAAVQFWLSMASVAETAVYMQEQGRHSIEPGESFTSSRALPSQGDAAK